MELILIKSYSVPFCLVKVTSKTARSQNCSPRCLSLLALALCCLDSKDSLYSQPTEWDETDSQVSSGCCVSDQKPSAGLCHPEHLAACKDTELGKCLPLPCLFSNWWYNKILNKAMGVATALWDCKLAEALGVHQKNSENSLAWPS